MFNKITNRKYKRGFSLLEMLLYVTLFASVIAVISVFFVSMIGSKQRSQAIGEVEQQSQLIMDKILSEIRNADFITNPTKGSTDNVLVLDSSGQSTTFNLITGNIFIERGASSPTQLNNDLVAVSGLFFANYGNTGATDSISVRFRVSMLNPGNRPELNYSNTFYGVATVKI